jgi:hypothetical protein
MNWPDGSKKTVLLDPVTSVGTFWTAPGYSKFTAFCIEANISPSDKAEDLLTVVAGNISEDEDKETIEFNDDISRDSEGASKVTSDLEGAAVTPLGNSDTYNNLQGPKERQHPVVIEEELEMKAMHEEAELLQYHYQYAHCSFNKLQLMVR